MRKKENTDYNSNKVYIFIIIAIVIFTIVFGTIMIIHKKNSVNNITIEEKSEKKITDYNTFYSIQTIVNNFTFASNDKKVYDMLDKTYIEKNNIDSNNAIYIAKNGNKNLNFKAQKVKKIEVNNRNKNMYIAKGILINNLFEDVEIIDKDYKAIVLIDYTNSTFSIYPNTDEVSKELAGLEKIVIEKNESNAMPTNKVKSSYEVCMSYFNDFTFKVQYMLDDAYNLIDESSKGKYDKEYIKNHYSGYSSISNCSYDSQRSIFVIKDKDNKELRFIETTVMNYKVHLE